VGFGVGVPGGVGDEVVAGVLVMTTTFGVAVGVGVEEPPNALGCVAK
jgi:hypothetical protein